MADLQRKQVQYVAHRMTAPSELDSQIDDCAKDLMKLWTTMKDPEMCKILRSNAAALTGVKAEIAKREIEDKLKKECGLIYVSPFQFEIGLVSPDKTITM